MRSDHTGRRPPKQRGAGVDISRNPAKAELRSWFQRARRGEVPGLEEFAGKPESPRQYTRFRKLVAKLRREAQREQERTREVWGDQATTQTTGDNQEGAAA